VLCKERADIEGKKLYQGEALHCRVGIRSLQPLELTTIKALNWKLLPFVKKPVETSFKKGKCSCLGASLWV
jgi:hypothetical protein